MKNYYIKFKRAWSFAKMGWSNEDWDYDYLIELIIFKLKRIRKCLLSNNIIEDAQKVHDEILECEHKFKAIQDDLWYEEAFNSFNTKYNLSELGVVEFLDFLHVNKKIEKEYHKLMHRAHDASEKNFNEAFNYFKDHIRNWWD